MSLICLALVAGVVYRVASQSEVEKVKSISDIQKEEGVPVETMTAKTTHLSQLIHLTGNVEGIKQADAVANRYLPGMAIRLNTVSVKIGDYVKSGQVIASFRDDTPMASLTQAKYALDDAERELKRADELFAQGAVSQQILDKSRLAYDIALSNYKDAEQILKVKAPISGLVVDVFKEPGESMMAGETVARIAQIDRIRIEMDASPEQIKSLQKGQKVSIYMCSSPDIKVAGIIEKTAISADPEHRVFKVWAVADNQDGYLKPGISVEADIVTMEKEDALVVARNAVVKVEGRQSVFLAENKARLIPVSTGIISGELVEITSGLSAGQKVVLHGHHELNDGDPLLVVKER